VGQLNYYTALAQTRSWIKGSILLRKGAPKGCGKGDGRERREEKGRQIIIPQLIKA